MTQTFPSNIDWAKATDEQLWTIISDDWYIPKKHLESLVTEALNRNLFDTLIKHLINKYFERWTNERRYNFYDLFQIGYIGVITALKRYQEGKGSFKTFSYLCIKSEFCHHIANVKSKKRKLYEDMVSLNVERMNDSEESFIDFLVDTTQNPERITVEKLTWKENLSKLSDLEREILILFSQGYSMNEISKAKGYSGAAFISRLFHRGAEKINPYYEKQSLKDLGLTTRTKGA